MGFRRLTYNWVECDHCEFETEKDSTSRDLYLKAYLKHVKEKHPELERVIYDLEALLAPFDPYKVKV